IPAPTAAEFTKSIVKGCAASVRLPLARRLLVCHDRLAKTGSAADPRMPRRACRFFEFALLKRGVERDLRVVGEELRDRAAGLGVGRRFVEILLAGARYFRLAS